MFYLAQIDETSAGKTLEIDLFDPGDVQSGATLRVLSPDLRLGGTTYQYATFDYSTYNPGVANVNGNCAPSNGMSCTGSGVTSIVTNVSGTSAVQQHVAEDPRRARCQLWLCALESRASLPDAHGRTRVGLVEDRVHGWKRQRHDNMAGQRPRKSGPPNRPVGRSRRERQPALAPGRVRQGRTASIVAAVASSGAVTPRIVSFFT